MKRILIAGWTDGNRVVIEPKRRWLVFPPSAGVLAFHEEQARQNTVARHKRLRRLKGVSNG